MDTQMNFVITEDSSTKEALEKAGFQLVQAVGNAWLFLNDNKKMVFADADKKLVYAYTNMMMF